MRKRLLCILLILAMIMTMLPMNAFAATWSRSRLWETVGDYLGTLRQNGSREEGQALTQEEAPSAIEKQFEAGDETPGEQEKQDMPKQERGEALSSSPAETKHVEDALLLGNPMMRARVGAGNVITKDTREVTNGIYFIRSNVINNHRLEIIGNVTIWLEDGFQATFNKGFHVRPGNTLTISGSGGLIVRAERDYAAIGGNDRESAGMIIINGGTIQATGGYLGAGIGGGDNGHGGNIIITGGTVTAIGGSLAAGIGGGSDGSAGTIEISGGTVTAIGGEQAAGFGGGFRGNGGKVTIRGGIVTATGGVYKNNGGAGIGGGFEGNGAVLTVTGGTVRATGGGACSAIGRGTNAQESMGTFKLGAELNVMNVVKDNASTRIDNPTPQKLDGITKVVIGRHMIADVQTAKGLTYNGKKQDGCVNPKQEHTKLEGNLSAVDAGVYTITATPEDGYVWADGSADKKEYSWEIARKDVSSSRLPVKRIISEGIGTFTAPGDFYDAETDENIPGTLTYIYYGKSMTQEEVETALARLPAGTTGRFDWRYTAEGNFTGTIRGNIRFTIVSGPNVTVTTGRDYIWFIPLYTATINVDHLDTEIPRVEHSSTGLFYTAGNRMISLSPITHFFIRVTMADGKRYVYEYQGGNVIPR